MCEREGGRKGREGERGEGGRDREEESLINCALKSKYHLYIHVYMYMSDYIVYISHTMYTVHCIH